MEDLEREPFEVQSKVTRGLMMTLHTWVNTICIWSSSNRSQDGNIRDCYIIAIIWMECPKRRITQSYVGDDYIIGPHELHKRSPCVVEEFFLVFSPPWMTLTIYCTIMSCWYTRNVLNIAEYLEISCHSILTTKMSSLK